MRFLAIVLLVFCSHGWAGVRLYVFDCGEIGVDSLELFGLAEHESPVRQLFVPCYLVEHPQGRLLWDGGLPKAVADAGGPVPVADGHMIYRRWIGDQLADMGLQPADIDYAVYSHLHFDHAGAANAFVQGTVVMQRAEWDAAFGRGGEFVDTSLFDGLREAKIEFIEGDHDLFGDGSVRLIYTPGHTAGHQTLLLTLKNTGKIMLSGDLYHTRANRALRRVPTFNHDAGQTLQSMERIEQLLAETGATLWIEHDQALADTLKKAPAFYD